MLTCTALKTYIHIPFNQKVQTNTVYGLFTETVFNISLTFQKETCMAPGHSKNC